MRRRGWGWLLAVPAVLAALVVTTAPFPSFHQHLALAGTPDRFAATVVRAGRADARAALWLDNLFVLAWVAVVPRLLRSGLERWAPERRRLVQAWRLAPRVALFAGAADSAQNVLALALVGKRQPETGLTLALVGVTWMMWLLFVWAIAATLALVVGPLLAPVLRQAGRELFAGADRLAGVHPPLERVAHDGTGGHTAPVGASEPTIGICVSGGGVRAASVSLGALRRLDVARADGASLFVRSRWLVGVSGGGYVAGGWRISRRPGNTIEPPAGPARDGAFDADHPWARTVRERRRFLDNGWLALLGGLANVAVRTLFALGSLAAALYLVGRGLGRGVRTRAVHPWFPYSDAAGERLLGWRDLVPARLVLPGALLLVVAAVAAVTALATADGVRRAVRIQVASVAAVLGGALLVLLVGVPAAAVYGRDALDAVSPGGGATGTATLLGSLSSIGVVGAVVGVVAAQLKRRWMRLGGVLLAVVAVVFVGKVVDTFAFDGDGVWRPDAWLPIAVLWLVALDAVAAHRLTLGGVYRKRLAATFALGGGSSAPLPPLRYADEPHWATYAGAPGPELVIAATAHTTRPTFCGLPAYGFTFRPSAVTLHDRTDGTSASVPAADYPRGSWWDGFPRGWIVSRAMALSGAAFASAMGRQALGTTNSLLVALDLRLGTWVPNPRFAHWFADPHTSPRVHLGYLLKELFNRYDPERDAFVYVADGGHRENLGLVELLRERPDVVFCVDASGDRPQSFRTLAEAIELARVELGVDVDVTLDLLRVATGATVPLDCAAEGIVRYPESMGGGTGRLIYGKAQLSEAAMPELLQYGAVDARFPDYSTLDQFLTEAEHLQLVALGHHLAERMVELHDGASSIQVRV
ncbi:MAG: hypothetical protein KDB40_21585 [Acidimicrobiales bacterium]|nr:hypothetical protein [Acidimicrobiales bacterium]